MKPGPLTGTMIAAALIASSAPADAQQTGWYGAVNLGGAPGNTQATPGDGQAEELSAKPEDWAGFAHLGYHLDPHWRVELQGGYKAGATTPAASLCAVPMAGAVCGGRNRVLGAYAAVANLIFDAMPDSRWVDPFAAIGVGASRYDPGQVAAVNPAMQVLQLSAGGGQLAYQALVGVAFRPHDRLHFDLSYRWMGAASLAPNGLAASALAGLYQDQTVAVSVRYALSLPRPAIPPAPGFGLASFGAGPPRRTVPRTVVVETPSDPAALADEVEAAVRQADRLAAEGRSSHVVVDGPAEAVSLAAYNARLSERRAKAMADAMVAQGVPASAVDVRWTGEGEDAPPLIDPPKPSVQARADLPGGR